MLRLLKYLITIPVAIVILMFLFANRQWVTVSFDPFENGGAPAFALPSPLYLVIVVSVMIGVVAGGFSTWLSQGRNRRALRKTKSEAAKLRTELKGAKAALNPTLAVAKRA